MRTPAESAQIIAGGFAAAARGAKADLRSLIRESTDQDHALGFVFLAHLQLEWLAAQHHATAQQVAKAIQAKLAASLEVPGNAKYMTPELSADTAIAVHMLARDVSAKVPGVRKLSDGFDGDPDRAFEAYKFLVFVLAIELGEAWAVSDEVVFQRLALECAKEVS